MLSNCNCVSLSSWKTALSWKYFDGSCWIKLTLLRRSWHQYVIWIVLIVQKDSPNVNVWCDEGSHHWTPGEGMGVESCHNMLFRPWHGGTLCYKTAVMMHGCSRMAHHHILVALSVLRWRQHTWYVGMGWKVTRPNGGRPPPLGLYEEHCMSRDIPVLDTLWHCITEVVAAVTNAVLKSRW